jgi:hypothetical protein
VEAGHELGPFRLRDALLLQVGVEAGLAAGDGQEPPVLLPPNSAKAALNATRCPSRSLSTRVPSTSRMTASKLTGGS